MIILINNVTSGLLERFVSSDMGKKRLAFVDNTDDECNICLKDSKYVVESARHYTGREFITIVSGDEIFPIYIGEYDTITME